MVGCGLIGMDLPVWFYVLCNWLLQLLLILVSIAPLIH